MRKQIGCLILFIALLGLLGCDSGSGGSETHGRHEYGEWTVTKQATCTEAGRRERACSCGEKEIEELPALGHTEVPDAAQEASCTKDGKTQGSHCSVCGKTLKKQEIVPAHHVEEVTRKVAVTCTRAGKEEGSRCKICGEIIQYQKKVRATGHQYENGKCNKCGKTLPDSALAVLIDQLNEEKEANVITKKAYKGGSTISFHAYVPKNASWWAVSYTTDPGDIGLYKWVKGSGQRMVSVVDSWASYSVTLPDDGKDYYIYIVGAKAEWGGKELLIDDVVFLDASGKEIARENFDNELEDSLFSVIKKNPTSGRMAAYAKEICAEHQVVTDVAVAATCQTAGKTEGTHCTCCGKTLKEQKEIPAVGHKYVDRACTVCGREQSNIVAAISIDLLNEEASMNFISKEAYAGGSTVSFRAYVPEGASWWAVGFTTSVKGQNDVSKGIYNGIYPQTKTFGQYKLGQVMRSVKGEWSDYCVTLPDDGNSYYFYIVGAKAEWGGKKLLVDDFKIADQSGKVTAEDLLDNGIKNGLFQVADKSMTSGKTVVEEQIIEEPCKNGHTLVADAGKEATCTEKGLTEGSHCSVCGVVVKPQQEISAYGHVYGADKICEICGAEWIDKAVAIIIDKLNEAAPMNFITKEAYAGGSTVSFKAYIPKDVGWCAVSWTTDPSDTGLYKWVKGFGQKMAPVYDSWKDYTITLPNDGKEYYIYIVGAKGEWKGKELLVDNFRIMDSTGTLIAEDSFDDGIASGLFEVIEKNPSTGAVIVRERNVEDPCKNGHTLVTDAGKEATCTESGLTEGTHCSTCNKVLNPQQEIPPKGHHYGTDGKCVNCDAVQENKAVSIVINRLNEGAPMNFITKKAYAGGSTISFKAYVPEGASWWSVCWTTSATEANDLTKGIWNGIYAHTKAFNGHKLGQPVKSVKGEWSDYSVTLPDDGNSYYIYIVGAKGEWKDADGKVLSLLIDDVQIQNGETVVTDNFNEGFEAGLFEVVEKTASNNTVVSLQTIDEPIEDKVSAIRNFKFQKGVLVL